MDGVFTLRFDEVAKRFGIWAHDRPITHIENHHALVLAVNNGGGILDIKATGTPLPLSDESVNKIAQRFFLLGLGSEVAQTG